MTDQLRRYSRPYFLTELQDDINRLFDLPQINANKDLSSQMATDFVPAVDIKDENDCYLIQVDVPGVEPNAIEVTMQNGVLCIRGQKESEHKETKQGFVRVERSKGSFCRQFTLPESVKSDEISAKSKNGVLFVKIPKSGQNGSRRIEVESES